jgi:hypothetical protein
MTARKARPDCRRSFQEEIVLILWSRSTGRFLVETLRDSILAGLDAVADGAGTDAAPVAAFDGEDAMRRAQDFAVILEQNQARRYGRTCWGTALFDNAEEVRHG